MRNADLKSCAVAALFALCAWVCWAAPARADSLVLASKPAADAGLQIDAAVISPEPPRPVMPGMAWQTYVVQPGDTLSAISARYGLDAGVLARRNNLPDPDRIQIGQVLRVSATAGTSVGITADGDLARLQIWPWPPMPGQTLVVWMQARRPTSFGLRFAGTAYPVVPGKLKAWALIPISPMAAPGTRHLEISAGGTVTTLPVEVGARAFETYDIPASTSTPILSQGNKVQEELERMTALFAGQTAGGWTPRARFANPLRDSYPRTSPYGSRRTYGGAPAVSFHAGEDFSAPPGTPVVAPAAGEVVLAEPLFVRGNAVVLDHGHGVFSGYWHLSKLDVTAGEHIEPGQRLGEVGSTGLSTGAHLHWELRVQGVAVDPLQWLGP